VLRLGLAVAARLALGDADHEAGRVPERARWRERAGQASAKARVSALHGPRHGAPRRAVERRESDRRGSEQAQHDALHRL